MAVGLGDVAPEFTIPSDCGNPVSLAEFRGKPVVLYFYPKDDTPGCTTEACGFRDLMPDFSGLDAAIIGVSRDSVARHARFKAKHDLSFTLGSDEDGQVCEAYGVWIEKSLYGRKFMGIERATFLIGADGVIRNVWRKVRVKGHVQNVLTAVQAL